MAKLTLEDVLNNMMTLDAVSDALVSASTQRKRNYLGMSEIGEGCWRMLWYRFRNVETEHLNINSILAIDDGFRQEDIMADRLRMVKGVQLDTVDPSTGEQFAFVLIGGHFRGHADGMIKGILEAPKTLHVWENKAVNDKKFKDLQNLIHSVGEKNALKDWDENYHAQAQMYMDSTKTTRHYLTVESSGGRKYVSCRTEYNGKDALSLKAKAESIITGERPPKRLSENRSFYKCNWCRMKEICFDNKVPAVNCRTCAFSEPDVKDKTGAGAWNCLRKGVAFTGEGVTCTHHLFLNTLVPFKTVEADQSKGAPDWIKYATDSGETFYNVNHEAKKIPSASCLTSAEMYDKEFFELCFKDEKIKSDALRDVVEDKKTIKKLKGTI